MVFVQIVFQCPVFEGFSFVLEVLPTLSSSEVVAQCVQRLRALLDQHEFRNLSKLPMLYRLDQDPATFQSGQLVWVVAVASEVDSVASEMDSLASEVDSLAIEVDSVASEQGRELQDGSVEL